MSRAGSLWRRDVIGWSLYDLANTIYSMNIVSLYLKRYIVEDLGRDDRYFDIPFSISMVFAALLLPALGAVSDTSVKKKTFLGLFTLTCCISVGLMSFVPDWAVLALLALFIVANFSYEAGQPFYNALLYSVADGRDARWISGVGVALGYVGSIMGMLLVLPFVTGSLFSIDVPFLEAGGKRAAFLPTALLFLVSAVPIFLWVRENRPGQQIPIRVIVAYRQVIESLRRTKQYPGVLRFLIADYFVEDAVTTVILNIGIYCSIVLGMAEGDITLFLVVSTVSAVLGSFVIGYAARHIRLKRILSAVIWGWILSLLLFVFVNHPAVVWILGSMVGILLGGLWTTTRPMLAELVPQQELGRFFGLFSLSGRAAAVVGPLIWTALVYLFRPGRPLGDGLADWLQLGSEEAARLPYRIGVLSLVAMMVLGLVILRKVPHGKVDHGL